MPIFRRWPIKKTSGKLENSKRKWSRPFLERLEDRLAPASFTWSGNVSSDWANTGNWSPAGVPGAADTATIQAAANSPVISGSETEVVGSLVVNSSGTLTVDASLQAGSVSIAGSLIIAGFLQVGSADAPGSLSGTGSTTIQGGTLADAAVATGTTLTGSQKGGTLQDLTLDGTLDLTQANGATISVQDNLTMGNGSLIEIGGAGGASNNFNVGSLILSGPETVSTDAPTSQGTVLFGAGAGNALGTANGSVTIGPGINIDGQNGSIGAVPNVTAGSPFVNQGTIAADGNEGNGSFASGGTIIINTSGWSNQGTIEATRGNGLDLSGTSSTTAPDWTNASGGTISISGGGTLTLTAAFGSALVTASGPALDSNWLNQGTITTANSTVDLGDSNSNIAEGFTLAALGNFQRTGGTVNILSKLTNDDANETEMLLDDGIAAASANGTTFAVPGSWLLGRGGSISGGTVATTAGATLQGSTGAPGVLDAVTLAAHSTLDLSESNGTIVNVENGLTLGDGSLIEIGSASNSGIVGILEFSGSSEAIDGSSGTASIRFGSGAANGLAVGLNSGATLTIGHRIIIDGQNGAIGAIPNISAGTPFVLQGAINADGNDGNGSFASGGSITVNSGNSNFAGGTLSGGFWEASGGNNLRLLGDSITTNAANILLGAAASSIFSGTGTSNALAGLTDNAGGGSLSLLDGANLTTSAGLSNEGSLTLGTGSSGAGSVLSVSGNYTESSTGTLNVQIGGAPGSGLFGSLQVGGTASLGGVCAVSLVNSFSPAAGQSFPLITSGGLNGSAFATLTGVDLGNGLAFASQYTADNFSLVVQTAFFFWSGRGPDNLWTDTANWQGGRAPDAGATLVFPDNAGRQSNRDDFPAGTPFASILFAAAGYSLSGNPFTLTGGISIDQEGVGGTDTVSNDVTLADTQTFTTGTNAAAVLALTGTLALGANTLTVAGSGVTDLSGQVTGTAVLGMSGPGLVQLDNALDNLDGLVVNDGTLAVTADVLLGNASVNAGGTFLLENTALALSSVSLGGGTLAGLGSAKLFGNIQVGADSTITALANSKLLLEQGAITNLEPMTLIVGGAGTLDVQDGVDDHTALVKDGSGTVQLDNGTNSYDGGTTVNAGALLVTADGALGVPGPGGDGGAIVNTGGTLVLDNVNYQNQADLTLNGGTLGGLGDSTFAGAIALSAASSISHSGTPGVGSLVLAGAGISNNGNLLTIDGGRLVDVQDAIDGAGGLLVQDGTVHLDNSLNAYTGGTTVGFFGNLVLTADHTLGPGGAADGGTTVGSIASLELAAVDYDTPEGLTLNGQLASSGDSSFAGNITLNGGASTFSSQGGSLDVQGVISGSGGIRSEGTVQLDNSGNSYTGGTTVEFGTLILTADHTLGPGGAGDAGTTVNLFANLELGDGVQYTTPESLTLAVLATFSNPLGNSLFAGDITCQGTGEIVSGANGFSGPSVAGAGSSLVLSGEIDVGGAGIDFTGPGFTDVQGPMSGSNGLTLFGPGALQLDNSHNSLGGAVVTGGTLIVTADHALGTPGANPAPGQAGAATVTSGGALELQNVSYHTAETLFLSGSGVAGQGALIGQSSFGAFPSFAGAIVLTADATISTADASSALFLFGSIDPTNAGPGSFKLTVTGPGATVIDGSIGQPAQQTSGGTIEKDGSGLLILGGNNTYNGTTLVTGGTVEVDGSQPASPVVLQGGTLTGGGTVGDIRVAPGGTGTVSPGVDGGGTLSSAGTVDLAGLTFAVNLGATSLAMEKGGSISLANSALAVSFSATPQSGQFLITNQTGQPVNGIFDDPAGNPLLEGSIFDINGTALQITYHGGAGDEVVLTPVTTAIWTGAGQTDHWSDPGNWAGNAVPSAGNTLVFPAGAAQTANVDDLPNGTTFGSLLFEAVGYSISGNALVVSGQIIDSAATVGSDTMRNAMAAAAVGGTALAVENLGAGGNLLLTGAISNSGSLLVVAGAGDTTIQGVISGAGGLEKDDAGTLELDSADTYTGGTTVQGGTLLVTHDGALGPGGTQDAGTVVNAFATLQLGNVPYATAEALTLDFGATLSNPSGSGLFAGPITVPPSTPFANIDSGTNASLSLTGPISIGSASTLGNVGAGAVDIQGAIAGNGALSQTAGTLQVDQANTYSGGTAVVAGTLVATHDGALGAAQGTVTVDNGGTLELASMIPGTPLSYATASTIDLEGGTVESSEGTAFAGPITLGQSSTIKAVAGTFTLNGIISGSGGLSLAGGRNSVGIVDLAAKNTYTGPTTIGAVIVAVTGAETSPITIDSGGLLAGTGTVGAITANAGGEVSPGPLRLQGSAPHTSATLTAAAATFEGRSTLQIQATTLAGNKLAFGRLVLSGALTVAPSGNTVPALAFNVAGLTTSPAALNGAVAYTKQPAAHFLVVFVSNQGSKTFTLKSIVYASSGINAVLRDPPARSAHHSTRQDAGKADAASWRRGPDLSPLRSASATGMT